MNPKKEPEMGGLIVALKRGEKVYIDNGRIIIQYAERSGDRIKLRFKADPNTVKIDRLSPRCEDDTKH